MAGGFDLILKGGTVVNQDGEGQRDVAIAAGRIAAIGDVGASAAEIVDCRGLHVLPGVIDSHVHFREPGLVHKEDLETGSRGAVFAGYLLGAALMLIASVVGWIWGTAAEGKSLEEIETEMEKRFS